MLTQLILYHTAARPLLSDVRKLLKKKSVDWDAVGRKLNVPKNYREGLKRNISRTNEDKLEYILEKWIESECSEVSWKHLIEVVKDLAWMDIAKGIEQFIMQSRESI